ncbi:hypothetical protein [Vibrio rumoiensis]|uniref:NADH dehydrogenase n=1 Tax=Vibrio rumoiensis 1S-45 TaxID=1188252 RepID=A0A1E5E3M4_9VIBR|nr:hypothetical protein [Vibrio rumoiensis]OEF26092.1 hypothetical protein A1QC_07410 [Vibrio rumoiensis 1S-45]
MLTRYANMTPKNQSYLFTFGLALTLIGMAVTDMWLPMVVGAIVLAALAVESWIRNLYIIPMKKQIKELNVRLARLEHKE